MPLPRTSQLGQWAEPRAGSRVTTLSCQFCPHALDQLTFPVAGSYPLTDAIQPSLPDSEVSDVLSVCWRECLHRRN